MTHFIGAVLVPGIIDSTVSTKPTKYPDLYGKDTLEWTPGPTLADYLNVALEQFNENREVDIWQPKDELIAEARKQIQDYAEGTYAEYQEDPEAYVKRRPHVVQAHIDYLTSEFPLKLQWTDEEVYKNGVLKYEAPEDIRASDGAVHTTYNPDSKWDWWTIGGRWEEIYRERQGEPLSAFLSNLDEALAGMKDPVEIAKLQEIEADIKNLQEQLNEQWTAEHGSVVVITLDDLDKASARRLESKAYAPWWFPYNIVLPVDEQPDGTVSYEWMEKGQMGWFGVSNDKHSDVEWIEKVSEKIKNLPADKDYRLVYIDFHI